MVVKRKAASFEAFKDFTRSVARGVRKVDPSEPKIWHEPIGPSENAGAGVRFRSLEAGAKLLSAKNRSLLRAIAERQPDSVSELAALTGRAEQNVLRTLNKLREAGIVRLDKGSGRACRPVLMARKIHFEVDLLN